MSQTLLFDVDGTLTDTFDKAAKIIDDLATTFKHPRRLAGHANRYGVIFFGLAPLGI